MRLGLNKAIQCRVGWLRTPIWLCSSLLLIIPLRSAKAGFIGEFALANFTLFNDGGSAPNGFWSATTDGGLALTGTNDGSGLPGTTDFTVTPSAGSLLQFDYVYTTPDDPGFEYAGYLLSGDFHQLADTNLQFGNVRVLVPRGELFGFRVGSSDNTGGPAVLTITNFDTIPEPSAFPLFLALGGCWLAAWRARRAVCSRHRKVAGMCFVAAALWPAASVHAQQVYYSGANITGQVVWTKSVNLRQQAVVPLGAKSLSPLRPEPLKPPPPRLHPPAITTKMLGAMTAPAPAQGLSIVPVSGITGFNAISHLDQRNANNGNQFSIEPPNQSIAVGNSYVLEGVNDAVQIYDLSGSPSLPIVVSSNQLFGLGPAYNSLTGAYGVYLTDMRVFYDRDIGRWIIVQRSQDNDVFGNSLNQSHLYIAVSQTGDPTGTYNIYLMDTTNVNHAGCPCVSDYPQIGADQYGFHVAWNEFTSYSYQFVDAAILTLSKTSLVAGSGSPTAIQFLLPHTTGYEFAIQPSTTPPGAANFVANGGVEYFVSTTSTFGNQIALWAMSNTSSLATLAPNPSLTRVFVPTMNYTSPDVATQRPGYTPLAISQGAPLEFLDGGDTRVQSLMYAAGRLYLTLQTGISDQSGRWVVGGAYIVLSPTYRSGVLAAQVPNQGYLLVNGNHLLRPAVAVNAQGVGGIGVTLAGNDWYPSAAYIPFQVSSTPSTLQVVAEGALPEDGFTGYPFGGGDGVARWGDYNTAVTASDGSIWMVVQYIGNYSRTQYANWNTYVFHKQP